MEGCYPRKASFEGIALPTNVTLGNCLPSMPCVVDVYLTSISVTLSKIQHLKFFQHNIFLQFIKSGFFIAY